MNGHDRYGRRQLFSFCAVVLLTPALRLFPSGAVRLAGRAAWLSPPAALPLLLLYFLFLCRLLSQRGEGEGLAELLARAAGARGRTAVLLLSALWLLFYAAFLLRSGADRFITTVYPHSSPPVFVVSMGLLGAWAALGSGRSLVRVGRLVLPLLGGILALVLFTALLGVKKELLLPVSGRDLAPLLSGALPVLDVFAAVLVLGAFLARGVPKTPGSPRAGGRWLLGACLGLSLQAAAVLGSFGAELSAVLTRPFFYLVRNLVFFHSLERVEALVVSFWVFPDFLMVAALLLSARRCLALVRPAAGGRAAGVLCGLGVIVCGCLLAPDAQSLSLLSERLIPALNMSFAFLLLPGLYLSGRLRKRL